MGSLKPDPSRPGALALRLFTAAGFIASRLMLAAADCIAGVLP